MRCLPLFALVGLAGAQLLLPSLFSEKELLSGTPELFAARFAQSIAAEEMKNVREEPLDNVVKVEGVCTDDGTSQYSGFVPVGSRSSYFFWLTESRSAEPSKDPLILWLTGGPGCASTLATLTENGPCSVKSGGGLETISNPWSWTEAANVVYVDQPAGTGFSQGPMKDSANTMESVGDRMFTFLIGFYKRFPKFREVPFFIFGESYAGHYVPAVATRVLQGPSSDVPPVVGIAIGNGLVSPAVQFGSQPEMAYTGGKGGSLGKGVVNQSVYELMQSSMPDCKKGIHSCRKNEDQYSCLGGSMACVRTEIPIRLAGRNPYDLRQPCDMSSATPGGPPCYNMDKVSAFLNNAKIQKALGVPAGIQWGMCSMAVNMHFMQTGDLLRQYDHLIPPMLAKGVRVLVYNGDTDYMVDWVGSKRWVKELHWPHHKEWASAPDVDFNVRGESKGRQRSVGGLTFVQIYNSGHLVPMDQPEVALAMVREFILPSTHWGMSSSLAMLSSTGSLSGGAAFAAGLALTLASFAVLWARLGRTTHVQQTDANAPLLA